MSEINSINDLVLDDDTPNGGTEFGRAVIEQSIQRLGAGRAPLADKNGKIIAGNHVVEVARELGLEAEFVHTNGNRLVVVVRDDLDLDHDARAREMSIADNRASEVGLSWRLQKIQDARLKNGQVKIDYMFSAAQLKEKMARAGDKLRAAAVKKCPHCGGEL